MGARLGQHFLRSKGALEKIITAGNISAHDTVIEVGPGEGVLTRELLQRAGKVIALEKDEYLCQTLRVTFQDEISKGRLEIIEGDALAYEPHGRYKIIANIPYYITGALIRKFLTAPEQPQRMVLLVQKEIAERIAREKKESILSLSVKAYGTPKLVEKVSRLHFSPPPSVDSAILTVSDISKRFFDTITEEDFFRVVRAGFASKRKMLANNLSVGFEKARVTTAMDACDISAKARAEDVPLEKWKLLTETLID